MNISKLLYQALVTTPNVFVATYHVGYNHWEQPNWLMQQSFRRLRLYVEAGLPARLTSIPESAIAWDGSASRQTNRVFAKTYHYGLKFDLASSRL